MAIQGKDNGVMPNILLLQLSQGGVEE